LLLFSEEIPKSKKQIPNKFQFRNSKFQTKPFLFGICDFFIGIYLEFGACHLIFNQKNYFSLLFRWYPIRS